MSGVFAVQGFGVLSNWNGQVSSASAAQAMAQIAATGANAIEITPRIWTASKTSSTVFADPDKTENDASLIQGIQTAQQDGLSVVLKPAITGLDHTMSSSLAPADIATFFSTYKAEIVHLAQIAQQTGVKTFAIGNELGGLSTPPYLSYWTDIIQAVRAVYHGELTYAAATDEIYKVGFWDQLDTIGANMYPPLSVPMKPTVQDIVGAWHQPPPVNAWWAPPFDYKSPYDFLVSVAQQYGKPVLMTEVGYLSVDYAGQISGATGMAGPLNVQEQADAYQAFFQVWGPSAGSWLEGVEFWNWDLDGAYSPNGFSPMGKPAQAIVTAWFKGQGALAADVASLTPADIAHLAALGITSLAVTDHLVNLTATQKSALGASGISLIEPLGSGSQTWTWNPNGSVHDVQYYALHTDGPPAFPAATTGGNLPPVPPSRGPDATNVDNGSATAARSTSDIVWNADSGMPTIWDVNRSTLQTAQTPTSDVSAGPDGPPPSAGPMLSHVDVHYAVVDPRGPPAAPGPLPINGEASSLLYASIPNLCGELLGGGSGATGVSNPHDPSCGVFART
jgi:hypothetical protein